MMIRRLGVALTMSVASFFATAVHLATAAHAQQEPIGQPVPWGMTFQPAASDIMAQISWFEGYTVIIAAAITLFVLALLVFVMVRFNARRNPTPSKTSHNTLIEVAWTIVPVLILVAIAFPSFRLLYNQTTIPEPDITVKATGAQWYWIYEYLDEDLADIGSITSYLLADDQRAERKEEYGLTEDGVPRLLAVDYPLVLPEGAVVHVVTTAMDVTHAVAIPALGIKADSWPGRINETWFNTDAPGIYYGQCSQLCGRSHAFMPLEFRVLEQERFDEWVALAKEDMDQATAKLLEWQAEAREVPLASAN